MDTEATDPPEPRSRDAERSRVAILAAARDGVFRAGLDPLQLYISIAGLAYFYLSNNHTLSVIFNRDLMSGGARDERLAHAMPLTVASPRS